MNPLLTNPTVAVFILLAAPLLAWAVAALIGTWIELWHFKAETKELGGDLEAASISTDGFLRAMAFDAINSLRGAAKSRQSLLVFDPDRKAGSVRAAVANRLVLARALAGILILGGLVATLWNLRLSVDELHLAFSDLATYSKKIQQDRSAPASAKPAKPTVDRSVLPGRMANVAPASGVAFLTSFTVISCAILILLLASMTQAYAGSALRLFADWLYARYETAVGDKGDTDEAA